MTHVPIKKKNQEIETGGTFAKKFHKKDSINPLTCRKIIQYKSPAGSLLQETP
jgi:hypothetical protein